MLILHRKRREALCIGDDIRIVVLDADGGGARLGIEAPAHITILREEIVEQVLAENLIASRRAREIESPSGAESRVGDEPVPARSLERPSLRVSRGSGS